MQAEAGQPISLKSLSAPELIELRQQLEQEYQAFVQNAMTLQQTATKFAGAGQAVEYLQEQKKGEVMFVRTGFKICGTCHV
jgi:hypothetical protein